MKEKNEKEIFVPCVRLSTQEDHEIQQAIFFNNNKKKSKTIENTASNVASTSCYKAAAHHRFYSDACFFLCFSLYFLFYVAQNPICVKGSN